jgi:plasmid stabilization system protein ParE
MSVSLVINVSNESYLHHNGLSGLYRVPAAQDKQFGLLVVYDGSEIQDLGEGRFVARPEWAHSNDIAKSIVGIGTDAGPRMKWGLLLCSAHPDVPRDLEKAIEEERNYLNRHPARTAYEKDEVTGAAVLVSREPDSMRDKKIELSATVAILREAFEDDCRGLVTAAEVAQAKANLQAEDQRLLAEGDQIWAGPEAGRVNVNERHKGACIRLGQERVWCYIAVQLVDCPGCGAKIKENVLKCPACSGWLDEGVTVLAKMPPKERRVKMYPDQFDRDPVAATGPGKGK